MLHEDVVRLDAKARGFRIMYHLDQVNRCPGCSRTHWYVGRLMAECAFCATALPLAETAIVGVGTFVGTRRPAQDFADAA
ncbi:MAG: hypothetical protein JWN69_695 [Alphaproteobacteria bacterium]|nr:hypothetical protein [Alphaproteobacteria bacterium]